MKPLRKIYQKIVFMLSINWVKTLYFNFRMFPLNQAIKLPVYFYGSVKFKSLNGKIIINAPLKRGMIGFGQAYEIISRSKETAEITLEGNLIFNGHVQFGKDYFVFVGPNANLKMGNMSSLGSSGKIICYENIELGNFARIGFESQLSDTTAHQMINTITGEKYPMTKPIQIGNFNYVSNRVTILAGTKTPEYCSIASNSLCTKDYASFGKNILIGGVPVNLIKTNISRDWDGEMDNLIKWLQV